MYPQISTQRPHHAGPRLASEDALARMGKTEQGAGVDVATAAVGGLKISFPGGAEAAPAQVLPISPLPHCFSFLAARPARRVRMGSKSRSIERRHAEAWWQSGAARAWLGSFRG